MKNLKLTDIIATASVILTLFGSISWWIVINVLDSRYMKANLRKDEIEKIIIDFNNEVEKKKKNIKNEYITCKEEIDTYATNKKTEMEKSKTRINNIKNEAEIALAAILSYKDTVVPKIEHKKWELSQSEVGYSTKWSSIPTEMNIPVTTTGKSVLLIIAQISRVQHSEGSVNTEFRIVVDDKEVGKTNLANHYGWEYKALSLHGIATVEKPGTHLIKVEYKTQRGGVNWIHNSDGNQMRELIVLEFKK